MNTTSSSVGLHALWCDPNGIEIDSPGSLVIITPSNTTVRVPSTTVHCSLLLW